MTRRAYSYFVLTFLLGVIVGGAGFFGYAWYAGHWHESFGKQRILRHLKHDLNLSDAQVEQLGPILDDWERKHAELKSRVDPQFQALREEFRNRVRGILNPEQREKFNELVRRHDERMKKAGASLK
jgi:ATP phosphoribosyltransferase regulatory subunit HisZ